MYEFVSEKGSKNDDVFIQKGTFWVQKGVPTELFLLGFRSGVIPKKAFPLGLVRKICPFHSLDLFGQAETGADCVFVSSEFALL